MIRESYDRGVLIRDLEWLVTLADNQHVTDTAAILRVSQPTLSRALARVEGELGTRLFERTHSGVVPSPHGELVAAASREILARYQQLRVQLDTELDPDRGVVRLAFLDSMATSLVPRILRQFHQHAPGVRVELAQEPAHDILRDLTTGAAELALTSIRPDGDFGWVTMQRERLIVVVPPTHRLASRKRLELSELAGEELVTTPVGFGFRTLVSGLLAEAGVSLAVSFESADLATIEGLVAAGLGIAIVPEAFAGVSGTVGIRINSHQARRTIGLTWRTDHPLNPAATRLRDFVTANAPYVSQQGRG